MIKRIIRASVISILLVVFTCLCAPSIASAITCTTTQNATFTCHYSSQSNSCTMTTPDCASSSGYSAGCTNCTSDGVFNCQVNQTGPGVTWDQKSFCTGCPVSWTCANNQSCGSSYGSCLNVTPTCNTGVVWTSCSAQCNGTQNGTYTQYTGGGSCIQASAGSRGCDGSSAPAPSCNGCLYTSSYSCVNHKWVGDTPSGSSKCNYTCPTNNWHDAKCDTCGQTCSAGGASTCVNNSATCNNTPDPVCLQGVCSSTPPFYQCNGSACCKFTYRLDANGSCVSACNTAAPGQCPNTGTPECSGTNCSAPNQLCSGVCTNTSSDSNNCGSCGNKCNAGVACVNGKCDPGIPPPTPTPTPTPPGSIICAQCGGNVCQGYNYQGSTCPTNCNACSCNPSYQVNAYPDIVYITPTSSADFNVQMTATCGTTAPNHITNVSMNGWVSSPNNAQAFPTFDGCNGLPSANGICTFEGTNANNGTYQAQLKINYYNYAVSNKDPNQTSQPLETVVVSSNPGSVSCSGGSSQTTLTWPALTISYQGANYAPTTYWVLMDDKTYIWGNNPSNSTTQVYDSLTPGTHTFKVFGSLEVANGSSVNPPVYSGTFNYANLSVDSTGSCFKSYTVDGIVFNDANKNGKYDINNTNETPYAGSISISSSYGAAIQTGTGTYQVAGLPAGTYTISYPNPPDGYGLTTPTSYTVTVGAGCSAGASQDGACDSRGNITNLNFGLTSGIYSISGEIFNDTNSDGVKNGGETDTTVQMNMQAYNTGTGLFTNAVSSGGTYSFANLNPGTYKISMFNVPSNYTVTYPTNSPPSLTVTVGSTTCDSGTSNSASCDANGNITDLDFGVLKPNSIAGNIFVDANGNGVKDAGEGNYTGGGIDISSSDGSTPTYDQAAGTYSFNTIGGGSYTISYNSLPAGYKLTEPLNGPPPSFNVTVGDQLTCNTGSSLNAVCDSSGNITELDFGISINGGSWIQGGGGGGGTNGSGGGDIRLDGGVNNDIPSNASAQCGGANMSVAGAGGQPGVIYSGNNNADFGNGQGSTAGWVVQAPDGQSYHPPTPNTIRTSYNYLLSNANQQGLSEATLDPQCSGGLANCTLSNNIPSGFYLANGDLTINGNFTFPANKNYIILVHGNLTLNGQIHVPLGSTVIFSTSGNITVGSNVGEASNTSTTADLEGIYSSDQNFIVSGTNNCSVSPDKRLNIAGNVIVNASLTGGTFINNRNLCAGNICPAISFSPRLDEVLNLPAIVKAPNYVWQEVAP